MVLHVEPFAERQIEEKSMGVDQLGKELTVVSVDVSVVEVDVSEVVSVVVSVVEVDVSEVVSVDVSELVEVDVSEVVSVVLGVAVVVDCSVVVSEVVVETSEEGVGRGLIEVSDVEVSEEEVEVSKEEVGEDDSTEEVEEGISSEVVTEERVLDGPGRGSLVLVASVLGVGLAKARVHGLPSGPCGPSMG